jgi:hypothetical protein
MPEVTAMRKEMVDSQLPGVSQPNQTGSDARGERQLSSGIFTRGIIVGLAGGLAGTIAMHVFGVGIFLVMGQPTSISFSIIGDAVASFFTRLGIELAGGAPLGMVVFYLLGLALGVTFVVLVLRIDAFRLDSIKKGVGLGILYVEVLSLPLLAMATLVLNMTAAATALWFGVSVVMHLAYGAVMGAVVSYGLRSASAATRG